MLIDPKQIDCVKNANEPGIRNPLRPRIDFENIIKDFFASYDFTGRALIDLGPGHYDFGEIVKKKGGKTTSIELDPVVIKLGHLKSMSVIEGDLNDHSVFHDIENSFDGLFNRGSFNARNFSDEREHQKYLDAMISTVKPNGVFWLAPCNDPKQGESARDKIFKSCVDYQISYFKDNGFKIVECPESFVSAYGIWSSGPRMIYTKNLDYKMKTITARLNARKIYSLPSRILKRFFS